MDLLFKLDRRQKRGLQNQLRDQISSAILEGRIKTGTVLPSSRRLAKQLGIARNTVMLAYTSLQDDGFIASRERSGFYVNSIVLEDKIQSEDYKFGKSDPETSTVNWDERITLRASQQRQIVKPRNWRDFKYCFVYGQINPSLFPVRHWRECWRDAVGVQEITDWSQDLIDRDDALLLEQIRTRLLPRRGLWVDEDQILVTVGAQNALYVILRLLLKEHRCFGIEEPGYPDARNIASLFTKNIKPLKTDNDGLVIGSDLSGCDVVYLTPSHQSPTTVTMSEKRRHALLNMAEENDFLILEDDYEAETNFARKPLPALMSYDDKGRVIYIGSLSKTLAPGLRLGYMVGPKAFISEARALRRLIMRHPPANNQRAAAYFLSRGHHESLLRSLVKSNKKKREILIKSIEQYLPGWKMGLNYGGSSIWVSGPKGLDARKLAEACQNQGVLIEPGSVHYISEDRPFNNFRLGYTSIPLERIEAGVQIIAEIAETLTIIN